MGDNQAPGSCAKFTAAIFFGILAASGIHTAREGGAADSHLPETAGVAGVSAAAFLLFLILLFLHSLRSAPSSCTNGSAVT